MYNLLLLVLLFCVPATISTESALHKKANANGQKEYSF
uniref:Myostatin n=1 Tax=Brugia timori TaxID=42155 RepID=A0A0R3QK64_9BILA